MTGTKRNLLGGAAVSLALVTMAASSLPARTQEASDVSGCVGLEGEALETCLVAEAAPELQSEQGMEADEPEAATEEQDLPADPEAVESQPEQNESNAPELHQQEVLPDTEPEPAGDEETGVAEDIDAPEAQAAEPDVESSDGVEDTTEELLQESGSEPAASEETVAPDASDAPEAEATAEPQDLPAASEGEGVGSETQAVGEGQPEIRQETEARAEEDAVEAPEPAGEGEAATADQTEATDAIAETGAEPQPAGTAEGAAVDGGAEEATAAHAADPEAVLSEEELATAQRESIEAAVQEALAAERQKSQAQQDDERDDRMRILGAAAAGLAAGAILPQVGAMLVGQQGDRVILQEDDRLTVRRDETARFLQEGSDATVEYFADGLSLVTVTRADGSRVLSWRDASGQVVRRAVVLPDGREVTLFDGSETVEEPEIRVTELPPIRREDQQRAFLSNASAEEVMRVLSAQPVAVVEDQFTLRQILANDQIRWLMPSLALDAVTFDSGSATLGVEAVPALDTMGRSLSAMIRDDPREVFLVEGHTDAIGSDIFNLALSDRRAETVATLLTTHYGVPPENLLVQGFGEQDLRVPTLDASRENRRVEIRRITPLLR